MAIQIRKMVRGDMEQVVSMMRTFYASPAVFTNGSEEIFQRDVEECIGDSPFASGYILVKDDEIAGYAMLAFGYSTEFGKRTVWIEDIYVKDSFRGAGIGRVFLKFIQEKFSDYLLRLEVERENVRAVHVYRKAGFEELPYVEMVWGTPELKTADV